MDIRKSLLTTYNFNLNYAKRLLADVGDDQMCAQPAAGLNHPAWVLGHLAGACDFAGSLLGLQPASPPEWKDLFGGGSKPVCETGKYPGKAGLLKAYEDGHARVVKALESADPAAFEKPTPNDRMRQAFPTVGDMMVFLLTSHESTHLGQLSAWRRAQGLPSV